MVMGNKKYNNNEAQPATAVYNFIPLNSTVLPSEVKPDKGAYQKHVLQAGNLNGYFDITLTSLTPLIIADKENFFMGKQDKPCIPGSSLRGCFKNIFKIITCSSYGKEDDPDFTDKQLEPKELYSKKISEHVPAVLKDAIVVDLTTAVFGMPGMWGSRVFFEDLYLDNSVKADKPETVKTLLSPRPEACRMYLEAEADGKKANYDGNTNLRGYKLYWHNKSNWRQTKAGNNDKVMRDIAPLPTNSVFKGRIRFESLTKVELGALCALFNLQLLVADSEVAKNCRNICYKIGLGKSVGLGSVSITGSLYLESHDYFDRVFTKAGFTGFAKEKDYNSRIEDFYGYVKRAQEQDLKEYESRIQELLMIMSADYMGTAEMQNILKPLSNRTKKNPLPHIKELFKSLKKE